MILNVLYEHDEYQQPHGCSHIRLLRPLSHPTISDSLELVASSHLSEERADIVVVERWWKPGLTEHDAQQLIKSIRRRGSRFIYTLDDNLLDLDQDEEGVAVKEVLKSCVRLFARECDLLLVSTDTLKARFDRLARCITVIPNALDECLFGLNNGNDGALVPVLDQHSEPLRFSDGPERNVLKIGFMGTLSHVADLQFILEPLRAILTQYGQYVTFELIGGTTSNRLARSLPEGSIRIIHPGAAVHYDKFIPWMRSSVRWDIGLAPLSERDFNLFKSDIKFLDYAAMGIPGIYSRFGPYAKVVTHGVTGLMPENNPDAWYQALRLLIERPDLRLNLAEGARCYLVREGRLLATAATQWLETMRSLM